MHVADPPVAYPEFNVANCRRRSLASVDAIDEAADLVRSGSGDGVVLAVLKKDGGVEYWVAGRALIDPVHGSGAAARMLDLLNRLPAYLSEPFPD